MNIRLVPLAVFAAMLVAGCGKKDTTSSSATTASSAPSTATPAAATAAPTAAPAASTEKSSGARVIEITANDQMKFSVTTITAKPGEELKVVLTNQGTLPKEAMGHNWVLLKAGTDPMAFAAASTTAKDTDYVAPSLKDQVIASIKLLGPKQTGEVTFKAPAAGEYPFLCSFPGHVALMKGTLTVK